MLPGADPPGRAAGRLDHVAAGRKPFSVVFWGSMLGGGGFAVFFGGSLWDGLAGAIFGAGICLLQYALGRTQLNTVASNLLVSLLTGLAIGIAAGLIPALHMDKIMIGDIMLMIPGLAMTNALRNMLVGNTISGTMRLAESLIWAAALAGGFMVALAIVDAIFWRRAAMIDIVMTQLAAPLWARWASPWSSACAGAISSPPLWALFWAGACTCWWMPCWTAPSFRPSSPRPSP